jgi:hypothetical protein
MLFSLVTEKVLNNPLKMYYRETNNASEYIRLLTAPPLFTISCIYLWFHCHVLSAPQME